MKLGNIYTCYWHKPYWETGVPDQTDKERLGETESEGMVQIEKKAELKKEEVEEAEVEPIHPSERQTCMYLSDTQMQKS